MSPPHESAPPSAVRRALEWESCLAVSSEVAAGDDDPRFQRGDRSMLAIAAFCGAARRAGARFSVTVIGSTT